MIKLLQRALAFCVSHLPKPKCSDCTQISLEYIAGFLPADPVIVEAGAHVGIDSLSMASRWPKGTIHAFEPVPTLYEKLNENVKCFDNIHCYPYALGDSNTIAELHISSGDSDGSSSLLIPKEHLTEHPSVTFNTSIDICTITLDSWAEERGISYIDFLWLDMQGYELNALKSAISILPTVRAIHTEVSLKEMYQGAPLYAELRQWLYEQDFRVCLESLPWEDMGNVLFVRSSLTR